MTSVQNWQRQGDRFIFAGHEIFYCDSATKDAPVLLLIHGFPTASWDWQQMWQPLCLTHRVLALDMLGFGLSDKPRQFSYSIIKQADLFEPFLRDRDVSRYHILAHDYGVTVAQELLARQQHDVAFSRIESIIFLNGGPFPTEIRLLISRFTLNVFTILTPIAKQKV